MQKSGLKQISDTEFEGNRSFLINEFKAVTDSSKVYISGYANTKGTADAYGDIPMSFQGHPVYDLSRIQKNPVMLMDHDNSVCCIMGNFVELREDETGLFIKALLMPIESCHTDELKQAVSNYTLGFARALSIAGRWSYADPANPMHLTGAYLHEISGVAVPADSNSLISSTPKPKSMDKANKPKKAEVVEYLSDLYRSHPDDSIIQTVQLVAKKGA